MLYHYEKILIELVKRITDTTYIGLTSLWINTYRGEGSHYTPEYVYIVAGRANYLLTHFTGENFGSVTRHSTPESLQRLQNRWIYWLLHIDDYQSLTSFKIPYEDVEE